MLTCVRAGLGALLIGGCASHDVAIDRATVPELVDVPFYAQTAYDCGPAALATILNAAGVDIAPNDLIDVVYIDALRGSLQAELLAATRRFGRVPVPLGQSFDDLLAELESGRPVLVLENVGLKRKPVWHYAVVVGFDAAAQRVILRSGTEPRRRERATRFVRDWRLADNWGFVAVQPWEIPASASPQRYMRAVVDAQRQLEPEATRAAYDAAIARWPADPLVLFLAATRRYEDAELVAAAGLYRQVLAIEPDHVAARNNLANVLLDLGCRAEALHEAQLAATLNRPNSAFTAAIGDTLRRAQLAGNGHPSSATCPPMG